MKKQPFKNYSSQSVRSFQNTHLSLEREHSLRTPTVDSEAEMGGRDKKHQFPEKCSYEPAQSTPFIWETGILVSTRREERTDSRNCPLGMHVQNKI